MMDHLHRELAPISQAGWEAIDAEARARLVTNLAARKLVDFAGPHGWSYSATNLGRTSTIPGPSEGTRAAQRHVLALVELRAEFTLAHAEVDDVERGATDLDLSPLDRAALQMAMGENVTVFHGYQAAGIRGITECTSHDPVLLSEEIGKYPSSVARATNSLRQAGIAGPYGLAVGPDIYTRIIETTEHAGHLLVDHLRQNPRRPAGMGAGRGGWDRAQPPGRGLRLRLRPGPVDRVPGPRRGLGAVIP